MYQSHIGIPKFIQKGFSEDDKVYCYNFKQNKEYTVSIEKLGTERNYYDYDVEHDLLAHDVEGKFSMFYKDFCNAIDINQMIDILNRNEALVTEFFSFMFARAKNTLETLNKGSITSQTLGYLDHSEFLRIQAIIKTNPLKIVGKSYKFYPLINLSKFYFINNSLGFVLIINKDKQISIIIPLNLRIAILVTNYEYRDFSYINSTEEDKAKIINYNICQFEKSYGNGFIFGKSKDNLNDYIEYAKKLNQL